MPTRNQKTVAWGERNPKEVKAGREEGAVIGWGGVGGAVHVVTESSRRPRHLGIGGKWKGKRDVSEWLASGTGCRLNYKKVKQQINGQAQN